MHDSRSCHLSQPNLFSLSFLYHLLSQLPWFLYCSANSKTKKIEQQKKSTNCSNLVVFNVRWFNGLCRELSLYVGVEIINRLILLGSIFMCIYIYIYGSYRRGQYRQIRRSFNQLEIRKMDHVFARYGTIIPYIIQYYLFCPP